MRKYALYIFLTILAFLVSGAAARQTPGGPYAPDVFYLTGGASQRNVVYESFLRPVTWGNSIASGPEINALSSAYKNANQPVLFIEQHIDTPINSERSNRFWFSCNAWGGTCTTLPWTMTDSGYNTQSGYSASFTANSQAMIYNSLARPPKAAITATASRVGDHFHFSVNLTNLSGVTLSSSNAARLFAVIYEVKAPDLTTHLTTHPVRAMASTPISSLANNASAILTLDTPDLSGVVWENLRPAVIADYRPGGAGVGYYDMLQAAFYFEGVQVYLPVVVR